MSSLSTEIVLFLFDNSIDNVNLITRFGPTLASRLRQGSNEVSGITITIHENSRFLRLDSRPQLWKPRMPPILRTQRSKSMKDVSKVFLIQVNGNGADLIVQSCDGVQFHLHRRYLEVNTGAFPGTDASEVRSGANDNGGKADVTYLTEPASVLEVVFEFVYPRKHVTDFDQPKPGFLGLGTSKVPIVPIAEAAEKYEVYPLMATTVAAMRAENFLSFNTYTFLAHAIKHDYPDLVDRAAIRLAHIKGQDLERLLRILPHNAVIPWICYQQSWREMFALAKRFIGKGYYDYLNVQASGGAVNMPEGYNLSCKRCEMILLAWVAEMEIRFDQNATFIHDTFLTQQMTNIQEQLYHCELECKAGPTSISASSPAEIKRRTVRDFTMQCIRSACNTVIQSMPGFSAFLKESCTILRYGTVVERGAQGA